MGFLRDIQHWGDSYKLMDHVPDDLVDAVIYSPPYIAGKGYEDETSAGIRAYKVASDRMFAKVARALKPTGAFILEVGYFQHPSKGFDPQLWQGKNTTRPMMYELFPILEKHGLHVVQEMVWHFRGGRTGHPKSRRLFNRHEYVVLLSPDPENFYFNKEELRDLENNVSYSSSNNRFGAAPDDMWSDQTVNARLREIAKALASGNMTEIEAKLVATETIACYHTPGIDNAVGVFMRQAAKVKPDASPTAEALREINRIIDDTFCDTDTSAWLIERVVGASSLKYHECPFPPELVDNAVRLVCPPGGMVLDPFAGSCMVGKAALLADRHFLAFERDESLKTVVSAELKYLKWLLQTWKTEGVEGLPGLPCPDALTYTGDDLGLRLRCLHARRALWAFYSDKCGHIVEALRQRGDLPKKKGAKPEEVISESGLCSCPHCQPWLR